MWSPGKEMLFKKRNQYASFPASGGLLRSASQEHGERVVLTTKKRMKRGLLYLMVLKQPGIHWGSRQRQFQWSSGARSYSAINWKVATGRESQHLLSLYIFNDFMWTSMFDTLFEKFLTWCQYHHSEY